MAFAVSISVSEIRDAHGTVDGPGHGAFDAAPLVLERPPSTQVSRPDSMAQSRKLARPAIVDLAK
jgi:hypothetical protein